MRRSSNFAMSLVFQSRRWTCHVPRKNAVIGMRAVSIETKGVSRSYHIACISRYVGNHLYAKHIYNVCILGEGYTNRGGGCPGHAACPHELSAAADRQWTQSSDHQQPAACWIGRRSRRCVCCGRLGAGGCELLLLSGRIGERIWWRCCRRSPVGSVAGAVCSSSTLMGLRA